MRLSNIFYDDVVIAPTITQITVLDQANGAILWQIRVNIQSNIAIEEDALFFVTGDTELMALNLQTGEFLGSVTFNSGVEEVAGHNMRIFVSTCGNQVVVCVSSSYQLFTFEFR